MTHIVLRTKCRRMNARREDKVKIGGEEVQDVEEFVYLRATVKKDGGGTETSKQGTRSIGWNVKIRLFKTLWRAVLLYGCETWNITRTEERRLDTLQFTRLRKILRI